MKKILFQGDSITDARRDKNDPYSLGTGYVNIVAGKIGVDNINKYEFINRGISGSRIVDVYARIKSDIINLKPDFLSILIGVNDVWHEINFQNGVDAEKFYKIYDMLLEEIYAELPDIKIMIMLPFVLEGSATCNTYEFPDRYDRFVNGVSERRKKTIDIAHKYKIPCLDLQAEFDEALKRNNDANYWLHDGVHPNQNGHELISRVWIKGFEQNSNIKELAD